MVGAALHEQHCTGGMADWRYPRLGQGICQGTPRCDPRHRQQAVTLRTLKPRVSTANLSRLPVLTPGSWYTDKATSGQKGYTYKWQQAREQWLKEHPLCVMCEASQPRRVTAATVVDHKIPHRGDKVLFWRRSNWQSLCAHHHSSDKQRQERRQTG